LTDRYKRCARRFTAAEVDNEHDSNNAGVKLHKEPGEFLIATRRRPICIKLRDDGLEGLA
jgi:hypothetical protein